MKTLYKSMSCVFKPLFLAKPEKAGTEGNGLTFLLFYDMDGQILIFYEMDGQILIL